MSSKPKNKLFNTSWGFIEDEPPKMQRAHTLSSDAIHVTSRGNGTVPSSPPVTGPFSQSPVDVWDVSHIETRGRSSSVPTSQGTILQNKSTPKSTTSSRKDSLPNVIKAQISLQHSQSHAVPPVPLFSSSPSILPAVLSQFPASPLPSQRHSLPRSSTLPLGGVANTILTGHGTTHVAVNPLMDISLPDVADLSKEELQTLATELHQTLAARQLQHAQIETYNKQLQEQVMQLKADMDNVKMMNQHQQQLVAMQHTTTLTHLSTEMAELQTRQAKERTQYQQLHNHCTMVEVQLETHRQALATKDHALKEMETTLGREKETLQKRVQALTEEVTRLEQIKQNIERKQMQEAQFARKEAMALNEELTLHFERLNTEKLEHQATKNLLQAQIQETQRMEELNRTLELRSTQGDQKELSKYVEELEEKLSERDRTIATKEKQIQELLLEVQSKSKAEKRVDEGVEVNLLEGSERAAATKQVLSRHAKELSNLRKESATLRKILATQISTNDNLSTELRGARQTNEQLESRLRQGEEQQQTLKASLHETLAQTETEVKRERRFRESLQLQISHLETELLQKIGANSTGTVTTTSAENQEHGSLNCNVPEQQGNLSTEDLPSDSGNPPITSTAQVSDFSPSRKEMPDFTSLMSKDAEHGFVAVQIQGIHKHVSPSHKVSDQDDALKLDDPLDPLDDCREQNHVDPDTFLQDYEVVNVTSLPEVTEKQADQVPAIEVKEVQAAKNVEVRDEAMETKAADPVAKPGEVKPEETKPEEPKPEEPKPEEPKPEEPEPEEPKSEEPKPEELEETAEETAEAKPTEVKEAKEKVTKGQRAQMEKVEGTSTSANEDVDVQVEGEKAKSAEESSKAAADDLADSPSKLLIDGLPVLPSGSITYHSPGANGSAPVSPPVVGEGGKTVGNRVGSPHASPVRITSPFGHQVLFHGFESPKDRAPKVISFISPSSLSPGPVEPLSPLSKALATHPKSSFSIELDARESPPKGKRRPPKSMEYFVDTSMVDDELVSISPGSTSPRGNVPFSLSPLVGARKHPGVSHLGTISPVRSPQLSPKRSQLDVPHNPTKEPSPGPSPRPSPRASSGTGSPGVSLHSLQSKSPLSSSERPVRVSGLSPQQEQDKARKISTLRKPAVAGSSKQPVSSQPANKLSQTLPRPSAPSTSITSASTSNPPLSATVPTQPLATVSTAISGPAQVNLPAGQTLAKPTSGLRPPATRIQPPTSFTSKLPQTSTLPQPSILPQPSSLPQSSTLPRPVQSLPQPSTLPRPVQSLPPNSGPIGQPGQSAIPSITKPKSGLKPPQQRS